MTRGRVTRAWLGVSAQNRPIDRRLQRHLGLDQVQGVEVMGVERGGPAARAGVREGDIVLAVAGREVDGLGALSRLLADAAVGATLELRLLRRTALERVRVVTGEAPT